MNSPTTVREALLAEAIGGLLGALEATRSCVGDLQASARAVKAAGDVVDTGVRDMRIEVRELARAAQVEVMRRVASRTDQLMRETHLAQVKALQASASDILHRELTLAMQRVIEERCRALRLNLLRSWQLAFVGFSIGGAAGLGAGWWLFACG